MDYYKKQQIKQKFQKSKWIIIGTSAFGITGLVVMLIGFYIGGWDILHWITSKYGITFIIMLTFFAFGTLWILYIWFLKKEK